MHYPRLVIIYLDACYSLCCRVVDRQFKFDAIVKEDMRQILYDAADFSGVDVLDHAFMSDHFHLEVHVPPKNTPVSDEEVLRRVGVLYGEKRKQRLEEQIEALRDSGDDEGAQELLDSFRRRMNDLSEFMKTFKQRFTMRYNNAHKRTGTLWEGRFRSTLLEPTPELLRKCAAYMDLNPMRAGMVTNPEDYLWCGYGAACLKGKRGEKAREGLALLYPGDAPEVFLAKHHKLLMARFQKKGMNKKRQPETDVLDEDYSKRQSSMTGSRVIGSPYFVMRVTGRRSTVGLIPLAGGYVAVGRERKRRA